MRRNFEADFVKCLHPAILTIEPHDHKEIWRFVDLFVCEKRKEQTYQDGNRGLVQLRIGSLAAFELMSPTRPAPWQLCQRWTSE